MNTFSRRNRILSAVAARREKQTEKNGGMCCRERKCSVFPDPGPPFLRKALPACGAFISPSSHSSPHSNGEMLNRHETKGLSRGLHEIKVALDRRNIDHRNGLFHINLALAFYLISVTWAARHRHLQHPRKFNQMMALASVCWSV